MSLVPDASLCRSVHKVFTSEVDGSFSNSIVESSVEPESLRPGNDNRLRKNALFSLKITIGWIDIAGNMIKRDYPEIESLVHNVKGYRPSSVDSQAFLSLKTSLSSGPRAISDGEESKLGKDNGEKAVAVSSPDNTDEAKHATARGTLERIDENFEREEARDLFMSATLYDGTLVIPSLGVCRNLKIGTGKNFSAILQIISQWRKQARDELKQGQHEMAPVIYVFPERDSTSIEIEVFRNGHD